MTDRAEVPLLVPDLPDRHALWPYLERIDAARQYSNFGPLVRELEARLAAQFAERSTRPIHVATTASATLGLELALAALDLPPGSPVLVPALTFVATATAVIRAGHVPVVADVDAGRWCLTPAIAEAAVATTTIRAVLPVAVFGYPQPLADWQAFEARCGVPVVVDAAGAYGSQWTGDATGTAVFSLHATKSLPAGEGGFVASTDEALVARVRQCSNFGINLDPAAGVPLGSLNRVGSNAKLSEYHAAVGLASLARWPARAALRRALMDRFRVALGREHGGPLVWPAAPAPAAPTLLCVRWPGRGRALRLEAACRARGIATRRWYQPLLHRHALPAGTVRHLPTPVADALAGELIGLPFFPELDEGAFERIVRAVEAARSKPRAEAPAAAGEIRSVDTV